jgi:hypothetical protein
MLNVMRERRKFQVRREGLSAQRDSEERKPEQRDKKEQQRATMRD